MKHVAALVHALQSKLVVELGTGDGMTASSVMMVLPTDSSLYTVNWPNPPSGDNPKRYLSRYLTDRRLNLLFGDTRSVEIVNQIPNGIDLLHIDSTHTYECATDEWKLYSRKLIDGAFVVVDDLDHNDMMRFWESLPYPKRIIKNGRVGVFLYAKGRE